MHRMAHVRRTGTGKPGWHVEDIKAELRKRFGSLNLLAERWQLHRGTISAAINRPHYSNPIEKRIAEALDVAPHVIWPDRWHPDGTPKKRAIGLLPAGVGPGGQGSIAAPSSPHRQKRDAA